MLKRLLLVGALGAALAAPAQAQTVVGGIGPRVGFSVDPDQLVLGGQAIIGEIAPKLTFDPSLEFGFGDNVTVVAVNFDLHYHFDVQGAAWRPYAGAGVGLDFQSVDNGAFQNGNSSDTAIGGSLILGAGVPTQSGNRFFSELKLGLGDIPTLKVLVGWNFKI
jgi:hypothetical protein